MESPQAAAPVIDLRRCRGAAGSVTPARPAAEPSTAQEGENAILDAIFATIGTTNKVCVDCGAFDLVTLSNVCPLWRDHGWTATLIEGNPLRALGMARGFRKMQARGEASGSVSVVHRYAQPSGPDALDAILDERGVPATFDFLSIDIDGNDYQVWAGLVRHRPRVVVIEYNATIPAHLLVIGGPGNYLGASARALFELGREKGYDLVAVTPVNLVFVESSLAGQFSPRNDLDAMIDPSQVTYAFQTYDGGVVLAGARPVFGYNPFSRYTTNIERCSLPLHPLPSTGREMAKIWRKRVVMGSVRDSVRSAFGMLSPLVDRALKWKVV